MTESLSLKPENEITRSSSKLDKTNRVGIVLKTCIFYGKLRKTVKKNVQKQYRLKKNLKVNIKKCVSWLDEEEMLRKISNIDFIPKEIRYHGFCRIEFPARARKTPKGIEEEMKQKEPA